MRLPRAHFEPRSPATAPRKSQARRAVSSGRQRWGLKVRSLALACARPYNTKQTHPWLKELSKPKRPAI
eukprot:13823241-Alexandrium_andersonii.AAC.1